MLDLATQLPTPALLNLIQTHNRLGRSLYTRNQIWLIHDAATTMFAKSGWACDMCGNRVVRVEQFKTKKRLQSGNQACRFRYHTNTGYLTKDHVVPRKYGGPNHHNNLRTLCHTCNNTLGHDGAFAKIVDREALDAHIEQGYWFRVLTGASISWRKVDGVWMGQTDHAEPYTLKGRAKTRLNKALRTCDRFVIYTVVEEEDDA